MTNPPDEERRHQDDPPPPSGYPVTPPPGYAAPHPAYSAPTPPTAPDAGTSPYGYGYGYGQAPQQPGPQPYSSPQGAGTSFFSALFDLSFSRFITLTFAKVIYVIALIVVAVVWLFFIIGGFATEPVAGFLALLLGWIPSLFYVVIARVSLEFAVAMIKTAENTSALAARQ